MKITTETSIEMFLGDECVAIGGMSIFPLNTPVLIVVISIIIIIIRWRATLVGKAISTSRRLLGRSSALN